MHTSNAMTAASGSGLDHQGIAEALSVAHGIVDRLHRPVAPQRDRHLCLLRQMLGGDLVTQAAHGIAIRTDIYDPKVSAKVSEIRTFGHKSPPYPYRVDARAFHRDFQRLVIDVCALGLVSGRICPSSSTEGYSFVCLANKHGMSVRLRIERDRANRCAVFAVELTCCVNETYRGFTAIHDSYPLKFALHNPSDL